MVCALCWNFVGDGGHVCPCVIQRRWVRAFAEFLRVCSLYSDFEEPMIREWFVGVDRGRSPVYVRIGDGKTCEIPSSEARAFATVLLAAADEAERGK